MLWGIEIEKKKIYRSKTLILLKDIGIEGVLVSNKNFLGDKKAINILLVTCIMIIMLSHYI